MGKVSARVPKYALHKSSGHARVKIDGREIYLGAYGSPESKRRYAELIAASPTTVLDATNRPRTQGLMVGELAALFMARCETYYRSPDGTPSGECVTVPVAPTIFF